MIAMNSLDARREVDQFGKFPLVYFVVARHDEGDQCFGVERRFRGAGAGPKGLELCNQFVQIERLGNSRLAQSRLTAAAIVQLCCSEHSCRAGDRGGDRAKRTFGESCGIDAMFSDAHAAPPRRCRAFKRRRLKWYLRCHFPVTTIATLQCQYVSHVCPGANSEAQRCAGRRSVEETAVRAGDGSEDRQARCDE